MQIRLSLIREITLPRINYDSKMMDTLFDFLP